MLWIILAIVFLAVEFGTVALISLWFVGGSVAALAVCLLGGPLWLQVLVFGLISLALLLLVRPFLKKYIDPKKVRTNVDAMRGRQAVLLETVDNLAATGSLELSGVVWTARSADGSVIPAGTVVTVQGVEGVKLLVLPVKQ
jgi:membrane protein implicated in regulation of membrane protease activity